MKHFLVYEDEQSLKKHYKEPLVDFDKPTIVRKWEKEDKEKREKDTADADKKIKASKEFIAQSQKSIPKRQNDPEFNKAAKNFEGIFKQPDPVQQQVKPAPVVKPVQTPSQGNTPITPIKPVQPMQQATPAQVQTQNQSMKYYQKVQPKNNSAVLNRARGIKPPPVIKPGKQGTNREPKQKDRAKLGDTVVKVGAGIANQVLNLRKHNMGSAGQY